MFQESDIPEDAYWVEVGGNGRKHPYAMHKSVNRSDVEVVHSTSDDNNHAKRWVIVRDAAHEVWVQQAGRDTYGYELQPEERVSDAELDAISLKQAAIRNESTASIEELREVIDAGEPEEARHALVALYYAAKTDPDVPEADVNKLREKMHEYTGHVDTSHVPTVKSILDDALGSHDASDAK